MALYVLPVYVRNLCSICSCSVVLPPQTEAETEHENSETQKPKPKSKTEKTNISVQFGSVQFGFRFSVKSAQVESTCPSYPHSHIGYTMLTLLPRAYLCCIIDMVLHPCCHTSS